MGDESVGNKITIYDNSAAQNIRKIKNNGCNGQANKYFNILIHFKFRLVVTWNIHNFKSLSFRLVFKKHEHFIRLVYEFGSLGFLEDFKNVIKINVTAAPIHRPEKKPMSS